MVFNSIVFLVFISIVLLIYFRLGHKAQNRFLLIASYVFYGWWDWRFLGLILATSFIDFNIGRKIQDTCEKRKRKFYLLISICTNLGILGFFKYFDFFSENLERLFSVIGFQADFITLNILLPVGISFYTFQSMSYVLDIYKGRIKATDNCFNYFLFVSFFPQLVAGPIERASHLLPQILNPRPRDAKQIEDGIWLVILGFVKKVVIADQMAMVVNWGFSSSGPPLNDITSWIFLYAFALQIYGDFSGYSDIARGLCKIMGFDLMRNFRAPYLVSNPSDFWRHWHISLSTWLRDYLYIPLGGNRKGRFLTDRNLFITMVLGGLWHGAGLAYFYWGLYQGILLIVHRHLKSLPLQLHSNSLLSFITKVIFFHFTCLGWLIFRTGSIAGNENQQNVISAYLESLFSFSFSFTPLLYPILIYGIATFFFQVKTDTMEQFSSWKLRSKVIGTIVGFLSVIIFGVFEGAQFIYFQF